jgi:hypothetical protein
MIEQKRYSAWDLNWKLKTLFIEQTVGIRDFLEDEQETAGARGNRTGGASAPYPLFTMA